MKRAVLLKRSKTLVYTDTYRLPVDGYHLPPPQIVASYRDTGYPRPGILLYYYYYTFIYVRFKYIFTRQSTERVRRVNVFGKQYYYIVRFISLG